MISYFKVRFFSHNYIFCIYKDLLYVVTYPSEMTYSLQESLIYAVWIFPRHWLIHKSVSKIKSCKS